MQDSSATPNDSTHRQLVVITDLDGSLLDHHTYSHAAAEPRLAELANLKIPVIFCTSKTRSEVVHLRSQLGNTSPFIVENGAAIFLPKAWVPSPPDDTRLLDDYWVKEFCPPCERWASLVTQALEVFPGAFEHFSAMSTDRVAELTGLSLDEAARAAVRGYGEPLYWMADKTTLAEFTAWFANHGMRVLQGGRFVHVGGDTDKGKALTWLVNYYRQTLPDTQVISLALGDGKNDIDMLDAADTAVVIRSPVHEPPTLSRKEGYIVSDAEGPAGWSQGVGYWLEQLKIT